MSGLVLALYGWAFVTDVATLDGALLVNDITAIVAASACVLGVASYLFAPRTYITHTSYIGFLLLLAMTTLLLLDTGVVGSPFIALWALLAAAAPVFGLLGAAPIIVMSAGYAVMEFLDTSLDAGDLILIGLLSLLPLAIGYVLIPAKVTKSKEDRAYTELADELSAIAGQSEIVIAAITDGVLALNAKGHVTLINPAAQHLIGWGKTDALDLNYKSILKLFDSRDQPVTDANDPINQALSTNREASSDALFLETGSGKKFLAHITASPVGSSDGVIIVFRDITKERKDEREQAEFISTASHEMRTPVASIEGYLGLALNPATATIDDKARDFITKAQSSAQHLGRLFQDLLDVTKAEDGRLANTPKVVDVVDFVHDIVQGQLPKATEKGLRVHYKPRPDFDTDNVAGPRGDRVITPVLYVNVDNDHLREIVGNLVENAIKYTKEGSVTVDVTSDDAAVTISVEDSGLGIPKEDVPHLFQKFYRVDTTDTREIGGTGLGLYLCRRLTEAIGGKIWVESEYKRGSTFFVRLPRIDSVEAKRQIEAASLEATDETPEISTQPTPPLEPQPTPQSPSVAKQGLPSQQPATTPLQTPPPEPVTPVALSAPTIVPGQPVASPSLEALSPQPTPQPQAPARQNTPLSAIEANPQLYRRQSPPSQPGPRQSA